MRKRNGKAKAPARWLRVFSLNGPAPADATDEERERHDQSRALFGNGGSLPGEVDASNSFERGMGGASSAQTAETQYVV